MNKQKHAQDLKTCTAAYLTYTGWAIKTWHFTFVHIFANYWQILTILLLAHSADNLL